MPSRMRYRANDGIVQAQIAVERCSSIVAAACDTCIVLGWAQLVSALDDKYVD
jgi:hypothetical protein